MAKKLVQEDKKTKKENVINNSIQNKKKLIIKEKLTKKNIFNLLICLIDITLIIYFARHNYANYVTSKTEGTFFIGDSKDLLFGKNYIVIIFSSFIYIYTLIINILLFKIKYSNKKQLKLFIITFLINIVLFFIFTKRIY